jgi:serine/threonine-protein kinase
MIAHVRDAPIAPSQLRGEIAADLQAVVLRCLEKDPTRRFPDVLGMDAALAHCRVAALWTEDRAAAWWRNVKRDESRPPSGE